MGPGKVFFKLPQILNKQESIEDIKDCDIHDGKNKTKKPPSKRQDYEASPPNPAPPPASPPKLKQIVTQPVPPGPRAISRSELAQHASSSHAWTALKGDVYDVTQFIVQHPGGRNAIKKIAGKDGTSYFGRFF